MKAKRGFTADIVAKIRDGKILSIRAGSEPHRFIGIWAVVVEGRVRAVVESETAQLVSHVS